MGMMVMITAAPFIVRELMFCMIALFSSLPKSSNTQIAGRNSWSSRQTPASASQRSG